MNRSKIMILTGILISLAFVIIGSVWMSMSAETLDVIAESFGASESPFWTPPIPDYEIVGLHGNVIANVAVGTVFTLVTLVVTLAVGKFLRSSKRI